MADLISEKDRATLARALKDLGFVGSMFIALVGAPSVLTLLQAALIDFDLSPMLQWLVDGYNDILRVLTVGLNPLLAEAARLAEGLLGLDLTLQPHWRPLYVLALIFVSANTRTIWGDGYKGPAILYAASSAVFALVGCLVSGLVPDDAPAWGHGLAAAQFVFLIFFGLWLAYAIASPLFGFKPPYRQPLWRYLARGAVLAAAAFAIAVTVDLSGAPVDRPGLATAFGGMFFYGAFWLAYGFSQNVFPEVRFGLRLIGGFLFAALVIAVDALLG